MLATLMMLFLGQAHGDCSADARSRARDEGRTKFGVVFATVISASSVSRFVLGVRMARLATQSQGDPADVRESPLLESLGAFSRSHLG
jgi:hypothetical protein